MKQAKKAQVLSIPEVEALLSAVYTQMDTLKASGAKTAEIKEELKALRSAEKKLRKSLNLK